MSMLKMRCAIPPVCVDNGLRFKHLMQGELFRLKSGTHPQMKTSHDEHRDNAIYILSGTTANVSLEKPVVRMTADIVDLKDE